MQYQPQQYTNLVELHDEILNMTTVAMAHFHPTERYIALSRL